MARLDIGTPWPFETLAELLATADAPNGQIAVVDGDSDVVYMYVSWFDEWFELATTTRTSKVFVSDGAPSDADGDDDDIDIDKSNSALYRKASGAWVYQSLVGPLTKGWGEYTYDGTQAASANPGSGKFKLVTAGNQNVATEVDLGAPLASGGGYQRPSTRDLFLLTKCDDASKWLIFQYTGRVVDIYEIWASLIVDSSASNPFTAGDRVRVSVLPAAYLVGDLGTVLVGKGVGTAPNYIAAGTSGQILTSAGAADPTWSNPTFGPVYRGAFDFVNTGALSAIVNQAIAGDTLGATGAILVEIIADYFNNSGAARSLLTKISFGGTAVWGDTLNDSTAFVASATHRAFVWRFILQNENATNAQRLAGVAVMGGTGETGGTAGLGSWFRAASSGPHHMVAVFGGSGTKDTTASQTLLVEVQHSTNNASLEIKGTYTVAVIPG